LPYLQYYLSDFTLIPIVIGGQSDSDITKKIESILSDDTLLVASSDLSHFLPYAQAVISDRETIDSILNLESELLRKNNNRACGAKPILAIIELARRKNWQPVLLHYSNSGDTAGNRDTVVGYTTIAFYGEQEMSSTQDMKKGFNKEQGLLLTQLARQTIAEKLGAAINSDEKRNVTEALRNPVFDKRCGVFVTLHIHGQLRGCIGSLSGVESVRDGIARNAVNAAFNDPRFKPLSASEFEQIDIEVSILSEPLPLPYKNSADLLDRLNPQSDGVIIKKGFASATFLPQVWEQLPRKEDFLSRLCMKAGLPASAWQNQTLDVHTYQVQYFKEESLNE
jgi:AmmeMemoRadiSam system protein A